MIEYFLIAVSAATGSIIGGVVAGEIAYKVFARRRDKNWTRKT
jgi:hypothetical protein